MPRQAALRGESGCSHQEGTARAEFFCALPLYRGAAGRSCCVSFIAGPGVIPQTGKTKDSCTVSSLLWVNTSGRALGCLAGLLLCIPSLVEGHCGRARKTQATILLFRPFLLAFSSADLSVVLSLLCCLPMNDWSSVFAPPLVGLLVRKAGTEF